MKIAGFLASAMPFLPFSPLIVWTAVAAAAVLLLFWLLRELYIRFIMQVPLPSAAEFEALGLDMLRCKKRGSTKSRSRRFKAFFGAEPDVVCTIWSMLHQSRWLRYAGVRGPKPVHLLWALLFLRRYGTEEIMADVAGVCEKTFRKWAWFYAEGMAKLDLIVVSRSVSCCPGPVRCAFFRCCKLTLHALFSSIIRFAGRIVSATTRMSDAS